MHNLLDISNGNNQTINMFVLQSRAYFNQTGTYDVTQLAPSMVVFYGIVIHISVLFGLLAGLLLIQSLYFVSNQTVLFFYCSLIVNILQMHYNIIQSQCSTELMI